MLMSVVFTVYLLLILAKSVEGQGLSIAAVMAGSKQVDLVEAFLHGGIQISVLQLSSYVQQHLVTK